MFAIKNYGLLWERKFVHWGWSGVAGHLKGYKGRRNANFRDQSGVYILYDKDMNPIYVGQAGRGNTSLFSRLKAHESDHLWNRWHYFSWFGLCKANMNGTLSRAEDPEKSIHGKLKEALNDIEGVLILGIEPKLNKQGPRFKGVEQWYQLVDDYVKEAAIHDVLEKQSELEAELKEIKKILRKSH